MVQHVIIDEMFPGRGSPFRSLIDKKQIVFTFRSISISETMVESWQNIQGSLYLSIFQVDATNGNLILPKDQLQKIIGL